MKRTTWNNNVGTDLLANFKQIIIESKTYDLMKMANEMQALHETHAYGESEDRSPLIGFLSSWIVADLEEEIQKRPDYIQAKSEWDFRNSEDDFED